MSEVPLSITALGEPYVRLWEQFSEFPTREEVSARIRIFQPRSLANLDCKGRGPAGRQIFSGKICYPRDQVVIWFASLAMPPETFKSQSPPAFASSKAEKKGISLTMKRIQSVLDHLGQLRPARRNLSRKRDFSIRETILFLAPKLTEMKNLGFTTKKLAAALAEQEITIKPSTLERYLKEYQAGLMKEVAAQATAIVLPEVQAAPPDETNASTPMRFRDRVKAFTSRIRHRKP
jgi:hypothetical protein